MDNAVLTAVIAGVVAILVAAMTGWLNRRTVLEEKTVPSYDSLAARVASIDEALLQSDERYKKARAQIEALEARAECLEDRYEELQEQLSYDRDWIKQAVALAEITGAIVRLGTVPDWIDLDSDSMRQRREEMRERYGNNRER